MSLAQKAIIATSLFVALLSPPADAYFNLGAFWKKSRACSTTSTTDTGESTYSYMNGGRTAVNRNINLPIGKVSTLSIYNVQPTPFSATLLIVQENSPSNFTVVSGVPVTVGTNGWTTAPLPVPHTIPANGTFRLAVSIADSGVNYTSANGYAAIAAAAYTSGTFSTNGYPYAPSDTSGIHMRASYCP